MKFFRAVFFLTVTQFFCSLHSYATYRQDTSLFNLEFDIDSNFVDSFLTDFHPPFIYPFQGLNVDLGFSGSPYATIISPDSIRYSLFSHYESYLKLPELKDSLTSPLTTLQYFNGANQEEGFEVFHGQSINENFVIGLSFKNTSSTGSYLNQRSSINNFGLQLDYNPKNKRVSNYFELRYSSINLATNGGLESDTAFLNNAAEINSPLSFAVNTPNAFINGYRTNLQNSTKFFITEQVHSSTIDSLDSIKINRKGFFYSDIDFTQELNLYKDDITSLDYYRSPNISDSSLLSVSQYMRRFNYNLGYQSDKKKFGKGFLFYDAAISSDHITWGSYTNQISSFVLGVGVNAKYIAPKISISLNVFENFLGVLESNRRYSLGLEYLLNEKSSVFGAVNLVREQPNLFLSNYNSQVFQIDTNWNALSRRAYSIGYRFNSLSIQYKHQSIANLVYLNSQLSAIQSTGTTFVNQLEINHEIRKKRVGLTYKALYQHIGGANVIRLPELVLQGDFYIDGALFNDVLKTRFGLNTTYFSRFRNNEFFAPLNLFALQNDRAQGNYPFVDVYGKFNVRSVMIYLGLIHPYAGLLGNDYFIRPGHPAQGLMYRIGFKWFLLN